MPVTIPTTTFLDEDNGFLGGGAGVSLREAVRYSAAGDIVQLSPGTYNLTLFGAGDDLGATGDLDIRHNLTIQGPSSCNAIIDGQWADRVLDVHPTFNLAVTAVEISRGNAYADPSPDKDGGGIRVRNGILQVVNCNRIHDSYAVNGGGIAVKNTSTMRMIDTQLFFNYAGGGGAGVFNAFQSTSTMDRSAFRTNWANQGGAIFNAAGSTATISNNTVLSGNFSFLQGGGVYNEASRLNVVQSTIDNSIALTDGAGIYSIGGLLNMSQSALYYNYALNDGGGMWLQSMTSTIQNSTISSNYAQNNGGGAWLGPNSVLTLMHTTFTLNVATLGGGIFVGLAPPPMTTRGLLAENYTWALALSDVAGPLALAGMRNVLSDGLHGMPPASNVVTPLGFIAPLGTCVGLLPTLAHDLLPGSPARDLAIGPPPPSLPVDQLNKPRGPLQDSGACESSPLGPTPGGGSETPEMDYSRLVENPNGQLRIMAAPQTEMLAVTTEPKQDAGDVVLAPATHPVVNMASPGEQLAEALLAVDLIFQLGIE